VNVRAAAALRAGTGGDLWLGDNGFGEEEINGIGDPLPAVAELESA
jgi:hypothetical protein